MDTYKVGTTANSTSTMHKLATTEITRDRFEMDDFDDSLTPVTIYGSNYSMSDMWDSIIEHCEALRLEYLDTKDIGYWKELIRILPEGWLQTRTWTANYSILRNIIHWRTNHRLTEWHQFVDWCKTLPYSKELLFYAQ